MTQVKITVKSASFKFQHCIACYNRQQIKNAMIEVKAFYASRYNLSTLTFSSTQIKS